MRQKFPIVNIFKVISGIKLLNPNNCFNFCYISRRIVRPLRRRYPPSATNTWKNET